MSATNDPDLDYQEIPKLGSLQSSNHFDSYPEKSLEALATLGPTLFSGKDAHPWKEWGPPVGVFQVTDERKVTSKKAASRRKMSESANQSLPKYLTTSK